MGADVHFFLEKRTNKGPWQLDRGHKTDKEEDILAIYNQIPSLEGRSYVFFGLLAGVRSFDPPIYSVRGLPEDTCNIIKQVYGKHAEYGYHTPSWLTPKELKRVLDKYFKICSKDPEWSFVKQPDISPFDEPWRIDYSAIDYVNKQLDWEKAENLLLGSSNKTDFRFVFWFDS